MTPPKFWNETTCLQRLVARALTPLGWIYGTLVLARLEWGRTTKVSVPVICVGNITMGGTGKTPMVIYLTKLLSSLGYTPHILTRGYGGALEGVIQVNTEIHTAAQVGDEPLLLARHAPVWRSKDRVAAAHKAINRGATILIMDDGLQNPSLHKDISFAIFDGTSKAGNGRVFPAGPLRQSLSSGLDLIDGIIYLNNEDQDFEFKLAEIAEKRGREKIVRFSGKVQSTSQPKPKTQYMAFAGIGVPEKFLKTLSERKFTVSQSHFFSDHYAYTASDIQKLLDMAKSQNLRLVTTEKDAIKIPPTLLQEIDVVCIALEFIQENEMKKWIQTKLERNESS